MLTKLKFAYAEVPVPLGLVYEMTDHIMALAESEEERTGAGHVGQCCEAAATEHSYEELVARYCKRVPEVMPREEYLPDEFFLHGAGYVVQKPFGWEDLTAANAEAIRTLTAVSNE